MDASKMFVCHKCNEKFEIEPIMGKTECDTPIGTIRVAALIAKCPQCRTLLNNRTIQEKNSRPMTEATIREWRKRNPDGTKKQCRRALGLQADAVDKMWNAAMNRDYELIEAK